MRKPEVVLPLSLFVDLDKSGPVPLYHQVSSKIESAILSGSLPVGSRLENEVALADRLGLSRPTIRRAIQELVDVGLLVRRRGVGTQVVHGQVTRGVELTSLHDDLLESDQKPTTEVLNLESSGASIDLARQFGISAGTPIFFVRRLRKVDGVPVAIMQNWLNLTTDVPTAQELERFGLYQLLRTQGVSVSVAKQRIGARKAFSDEADLLEVERGSALLTMERLSYDSDGRAIELGRHVYRPDLYSFETTLVNK